jgi:hypothetical protein
MTTTAAALKVHALRTELDAIEAKAVSEARDLTPVPGTTRSWSRWTGHAARHAADRGSEVCRLTAVSGEHLEAPAPSAPGLRPDYFATYGRPRPAETLGRTALTARVLIRMRSEVQVLSGPLPPHLACGNAYQFGPPLAAAVVRPPGTTVSQHIPALLSTGIIGRGEGQQVMRQRSRPKPSTARPPDRPGSQRRIYGGPCA